MKAGPIGVSASIWALVAGAGFVGASLPQLNLDFTSNTFQSTTGFYGSAKIVDSVTPSNNYFSSPDKTQTSLLTYSSPSPKIELSPSGILQYRPHNLCLRSEDLSGVTWGKTGGTASVTTFTEDTSTGNHQFRQIISGVLSGYTYNFSIDLTANGRTAFLVEVTSGVADAYAYVDLSTGTIASSGGTTGTPTITSLGVANSYRITIPLTALAITATAFVYCATAPNAGGISYTGNGTSGVIASRAQFTTTPADTTYLTTVASARFSTPYEWNSSAVAQGALFEKQATNLAFRSQEISNVGNWSRSNVDVTADQTTAPDGTITADLLTATATGSSDYIAQSYTVSTTTTYTFSIFVKKGSSNWVNLTLYDAANGNRFWYNVNTGVVGSTAIVGGGLTNPSAKIINYGNGWYRCIFTATTKAATALTSYITFTDNDNSLTWTTGNTGYLWGAQIQSGTYASSYINTIASNITHVADNISIATSAFQFSTTAGTLLLTGKTPSGSGTLVMGQIDDGTENNRFRIVRDSSNDLRFIVTTSTTEVCNINLGTVANDTSFKVAVAWADNDFAACLNGGTVGTDVSGTLPTVTSFKIGKSSTSGEEWGGYISNVLEYPRRASNTELQSLST